MFKGLFVGFNSFMSNFTTLTSKIQTPFSAIYDLFQLFVMPYMICTSMTYNKKSLNDYINLATFI